MSAHGARPVRLRLRRAASFDVLTAGALAQGYLLVTALLPLPLGIVVQQRRRPSTGHRSELLFRRNFTESLVGMASSLRRRRRRPSWRSSSSTTPPPAARRRPRLAVGRGFGDVLDTGEALDLIAAADPAPAPWTAGAADVRAGRAAARPGRRSRSRCSPTRATTPIFAAQLLDVTAEYDARRPLEAAEQLTSATLDTAACIILVTDLDGEVVRVNAATTALTGFNEPTSCSAARSGRPASRRPDASDVEALFMWPNRSGVRSVRERDAMHQVRRAAAGALEHQLRPRRARRPDVRRDDRHRRDRRAHHGRAVNAPDGGGDHHRADRHRPARPDHRLQLRRRSTARLRRAGHGRHSRSTACCDPRARRAHRRGRPDEALRDPGRAGSRPPARPGPATGPGSARTGASTSSR